MDKTSRRLLAACLLTAVLFGLACGALDYGRILPSALLWVLGPLGRLPTAIVRELLFALLWAALTAAFGIIVSSKLAGEGENRVPPVLLGSAVSLVLAYCHFRFFRTSVPTSILPPGLPAPVASAIATLFDIGVYLLMAALLNLGPAIMLGLLGRSRQRLRPAELLGWLALAAAAYFCLVLAEAFVLFRDPFNLYGSAAFTTAFFAVDFFGKALMPLNFATWFSRKTAGFVRLVK